MPADLADRLLEALRRTVLGPFYETILQFSVRDQLFLVVAVAIGLLFAAAILFALATLLSRARYERRERRRARLRRALEPAMLDVLAGDAPEKSVQVRVDRRDRALFIDFLLEYIVPRPVTLIAPAYNEEATCVDAVRALLGLEYPDYTIVVVNDGSRDATLERLRAAFDLEHADRFPSAELSTARVRAVFRSRTHPDVWVVDKENGGKADALNAGLNYCRIRPTSWSSVERSLPPATERGRASQWGPQPGGSPAH